MDDPKTGMNMILRYSEMSWKPMWCWHDLFQSTQFECWIIVFEKTPSFRPKCIKISLSPERCVKLKEMELYSLSSARKNCWHVATYIRAWRHTLQSCDSASNNLNKWINEKALIRSLATKAHNKVKNKIGQKYQGHSSGKSFAKELQEENKDRKQARRCPTAAAATATYVESLQGICHGTAKPWKLPAFSRNFECLWPDPKMQCSSCRNVLTLEKCTYTHSIHRQPIKTPKNPLQIILDKLSKVTQKMMAIWQFTVWQLGFYRLWSGFICADSQGWMQKLGTFLPWALR